MSKKRINSRIKNLFADLGEESQTSQQSEVALLVGWTWEADARGYYIAISSEMLHFLGIPPEEWLGQPLSSGLDQRSSQILDQALQASQFPVDVKLQFHTRSNEWLATEVQIYPIPWRPDEPFRQDMLQGWRAIVRPLVEVSSDTLPAPSQPEELTSGRPARPRATNKKKQPATPKQSSSRATSLQPFRPGEPTGYQGEDQRRSPSQNVLTDPGKQSLTEKQAVARSSAEDGAAVLVLSTPLTDGRTSLLFELLDEEPGRKWNDAERLLVEQVADQMTLALENAQLFQQTQSALAATSALYEASAAISAAQSYDEILEALRQHTILGSADKHLALHFFNHPWTETNPADKSEIISGWSSLDLDIRHTQIHLHEISTAQAFLVNDRVILIEDLTPYASIEEIQEFFIDRCQVTSLVIVPLVTGGQWLGFISAGDCTAIHLSAEENRRLMALSSQAAIALNNMHLLAEARQRNLELAAINSVIAAASRSLALEAMLDEVLDRVLDTVDYAAGMITLVDGSGSLHIAIQHQMPTQFIDKLEKDGLKDTLSQLVFTQHQSISVGDLENHSPVDSSNLVNNGLRTYMGVPLESKGHVLGTICVFGKQIQSGEQAQLPLLQAIGQQVAVAVENASLFEETQKRSAELAVINRVVAAVAGSMDLHASLGIIASELGKTLGVQTGIALLNEEQQVMTIVASYSPIPNAPDVIGIELPVQGNPSTQQVLATRKTLIIEEAQLSPLTATIHEELRLRSIETLMLIPLISGNRVIGTVGLDILEKGRLFKPEEIRLAETIVLQASTAIQNTRLFEQTEQALAETETLYKASAAFNETNNYADILEILRSYTMIGHGAAASMLALFEEPPLIGSDPLSIPDWYTPIAIWSANPMQSLSINRSSMKELPAADDLLKPDAPSIILNVENDLRLDYQARRTYGEHYQAKSVLFAPLVTGGRWIGFLSAFFSQAEDLSNPDIRRLMVLVGQASIAVQNIRLLEESRRKADQLQTAAEIARDTSSTLALDALLLRVVNLLCDRFGYNHASVFLLDDEGTYAVVREATGEAGAEMKQRPHKLGVGSQSVIGTVTHTGQPLVVNDVSQNPVHKPNPLLPETRAELGIPLKIGERVIGALDVQSNETNAFTQDDVAVLQVLADQVAVAVDNARAYMLSQQAVAEMREVDRLKSQFLANMSHELRTPLNSIIGFSRVILKGIDGPLTELQEQDLAAIYNSGQHLLNLINDVLDLSKIEAGKLELAFDDKVNLTDLINSVMSTVVGLVKDKPINLTRDIATDLPTVRADPTKIRQILINLFSNAAKFTEQGSVGIKAFKQTGPNGKPEVMVQVTDTGPGIALEHQAKLFQPFSQVDDSLTRRTGGTGLGLSICRHLVEMHGGRIGLESHPGIGSTFFFTIPVQPSETQDLGGKNAKLVLVIDDERPIVQLYERYLTRHGYRVIGLSETHDAVRRAREVMPYAILLDVMMPGRDGWHVLQDLKSNPDTSSIPVIMCTILESQAKGESLGADGYLVKPILEEELVRTLSSLEKKPHTYSILGITDNDREFEHFQSIFQDLPEYQLGLAYGGHQAISAIHYRRPDAILMAIEPGNNTPSPYPMTGLSGISLLETIRNDPKLQGMPVILLTDLPLDAQTNTRLQELASAILPKGKLAKDKVLETIQDLLRERTIVI